MSKINLSPINNLQNESSVTAAINSNSAVITQAVENSISRDGTQPNQMNSELDMNSNQIINLPDAITDQEPVTYSQFITGITSVDNGAVIDGDFVVLAHNDTMLNDRVLTAGENLDLIDGGAKGNVEIRVSDAELNAIALLSSAADKLPYFTDVGVADVADFTSFARELLDDADASTMRDTLGLTLGTDTQPHTDLLDSLNVSGTGIVTKTDANTITPRTVTGTSNEITVTNGSGVSGDPTISLPVSITLTGKTLTGGSFVAPALGTPASGIATNLTGTAAGLTAGNVTTNANLTGDVTSVGNASTIANNAVTNAKLATAADSTIKSNVSGSTATPSDNTITAVLDKQFGTAQGTIAYRGASAWEALTPGISGDFLKTQGSAANPIWDNIPGGGDLISTNNLSDLTNSTTALTNLGGTAVGKAVFIATDASAARTAIAISTEVGKIEHWPTSDVPAGRLRCDGTSYSRTSYADLVTVLVKTGTATFTNGSPNVGMTSHGRSVGDPIKLFTSGSLPTNFTAGTHGLATVGTNYFVKTVVDANTVVLSTTVAGSSITAGSAGSGTHTWVCAPHGDGDGSTTFTVPEYRGEFLRSWDYGRGVDANRAIGNAQTDAFQGHWHPVNPTGSQSTGVGASFIRGGDATGGGVTVTAKDAATDGVNGTPRTATETRPRNVSVNVTIRYAA